MLEDNQPVKLSEINPEKKSRQKGRVKKAVIVLEKQSPLLTQKA